MVFCTRSVGCGCVDLGRELCVLWKLLFGAGTRTACTVKVTVRTVTFTVHTARVPAPHNHSQHQQCRISYAAVHTLVLLMMGIMMPETCWDRSLIINIRLVASCWFLSLHPTFMMHGHKSLKNVNIIMGRRIKSQREHIRCFFIIENLLLRSSFFLILTACCLLISLISRRSPCMDDSDEYKRSGRKTWRFLSYNKMKSILSFYVNLLLKLSLSQSILITIFTSWI